ncbi:hypothetical protein EW026_g704 [Hermanssonia centrifuga]|uniref:Uncharacterized protein n=1 Tax=Hermanssonia centrifuga TaxID=98765 RepID=A0A4S4KU71_9APHY|nr:hypothetical protein EW026_g704 [Hermanssonia centrifuga]
MASRQVGTFARDGIAETVGDYQADTNGSTGNADLVAKRLEVMESLGWHLNFECKRMLNHLTDMLLSTEISCNVHINFSGASEAMAHMLRSFFQMGEDEYIFYSHLRLRAM